MTQTIKPQTGFLHQSKTSPNLWQGNFNYQDKEVEQNKCPMVLIDFKSKIMATLREKDEELIGPPEQVAQVVDDVPINGTGIIDVNAFSAGEFHEPVFRSASFAWFLYKNSNGTPFLYMVNDERPDFGTQVAERLNGLTARATAYEAS